MPLYIICRLFRTQIIAPKFVASGFLSILHHTEPTVNHAKISMLRDVICVKSAVSVSVEKGFLRVIGEISIGSSKKDMEAFVAEIQWNLLGDKELSQTPSFGLSSRELCEADAAIYIGRSKSFLRNCRREGKKGKRPRGPKYTRASERSIRYPVEELDKWLANCARYEVTREEPQNTDEQ